MDPRAEHGSRGAWERSLHPPRRGKRPAGPVAARARGPHTASMLLQSIPSSGPDPGPLRRLADRTAAPPRVALVVAHPDDETIGAGALLGRLPDAHVVHLTDGAPRDPWFASRAGCADRAAYARLRRAELESALGLAGVGPGRLYALGAIDQEAARELVRLAEALAGFLDRLRPALVLTHPYEGGHPDHDAAAFAAHAAIRLLARDGADAPQIAEMAFYFEREGALVRGEFLPPASGIEEGGGGGEIAIPLTPAERDRKCAMLERFASQREVLAPFPVEREQLRPASAPDFRRPPHEGPLHYERFGWPLDGARFRALAARAIAELRLDPE